MVKISYPLESMAVCPNVKCQDQQDGLINFGIQGCVLKPSVHNGQRYLVPVYFVRLNCAHCNKEIPASQVPSGAEIHGLPFRAARR